MRDDLMRPVYHPAGGDDDLRVAMVELQAGRWRAARNLLLATSAHGLRTSRTQVLAVAAAGADVVDVWLAEEPDAYDPQMMRARVFVERALRAHRQQHTGVAEFETRARHAAQMAAQRAPQDPVPWVCLLALAQIDRNQRRPEHRVRSAEPMLPPGPWQLLDEVVRRDPYNREAYHRVLQFLLSRNAPPSAQLASVFDFGRWVASWAPAGTPMLLLPAYAQVEQCRLQRAEGKVHPLWRRQWAEEPMHSYSLDAFHGWFKKADPAMRSLTDLNYLAYALWAGHQYLEAAAVFTAMTPYATREPWASLEERPPGPNGGQELMLRARRESLAYANSHAPPASPRQSPAGHTSRLA
ncbi:hypothetical protein OHT20_31435 [Streptomyces caniferus]|uniref:hypothetical protein n=1 Tax=Streptomyces caniferus TaxID=285557 RepID=UPI002E2A32E9|nr:hypothetical protein [Streptomyces caniferus]